MSHNKDESALVDRTNSLLSQFNGYSFKSEELKSQAPIRSQPASALSQSQGYTDNFTRLTMDHTQSLTAAFSDSGLVMDPEDKDKIQDDLVAYKKLVSSLKYAYLESNIKYSFAAHIMNKEGPVLFAIEANDEKEKERIQMKEELRARKKEAAELEALIREEAERLDERLEKTTQDAQLSAQLLKECEEMELEITMLRNKRTPVQRITIAEADTLADEQLSQLATFGPEIKRCEKEMKGVRERIRGYKSALEKLEKGKRELKRELEERRDLGTRNEKAEVGCAWLKNSTALYSGLLGIKSAQSLGGNPPKEMRIEYASPMANQGGSRTLSIQFDDEGKMKGANIVDSSDDIEDIVQAYLESQDLPGMIQEIRCRIGR